MPKLATAACLQLCRWLPAAGESLDGLPLFRCRGCGSEWVSTEEWTPVDADGGQHGSLQAELARRQVTG